MAMTNVVDAKTLIVTHPQVEFDSDSKGGPATRLLLEDLDFRKKIVLVTNGGQDKFTFDSGDLSFEIRPSSSGEIEWLEHDSDIVVVGGHYTACFFNTVQSVVQFSRENIKIQIPMAGVYHDAVAVGFFSGLTKTLDGLGSRAPITMADYFSSMSTQDLRKAIISFGQHIYDHIPDRTPLHPGRSNQGISVELLLDGVPVSKIGNGSQIVAVEFKR